mmetsp:Transcript_28198/g.50904  ORF Transcript_28198/g.50904 Transcript_28198/m.50904 type:complete len:241 (+) Transcript_28198:570-1292(+)
MPGSNGHAVEAHNGAVLVQVTASKVVVLLQSQILVEEKPGIVIHEEVSNDEMMPGQWPTAEGPRAVPEAVDSTKPWLLRISTHLGQHEPGCCDWRHHELLSCIMGCIYGIHLSARSLWAVAVLPGRDVIRALNADFALLASITQHHVSSRSELPTDNSFEAKRTILFQAVCINVPGWLHPNRCEGNLNCCDSPKSSLRASAPSRHDAEMEVLGRWQARPLIDCQELEERSIRIEAHLLQS